jgi:RND family efflux transporter MFP subunit
MVKERKGTGENKMKNLKLLKLGLIALILGTIVILPISCAQKTEKILESQLFTVQRGDLTVDITAAGNLTYADYQDLAFQISGTSTQEPLTVAEVLVEEGDSVEEGQVLVKADTVYLERAATTAERAVKTSQIALDKAEASWSKITYPYHIHTLQFDVPTAIAFTGDAQREIDSAVEVMQELGLSREQYDYHQYWEVWHNLVKAQDDLEQVQANLRVLSGPDLFGEGIVPMEDYWTLKAAQLDMESAQVSLDTANDNLAQAKEKLEEAVIVAPFAGFVTIVNVDGGDEVQRGVVAVRLVDPTKFEAELMVNEMDIFQLKLGGEATVQIDAMPALTLPAKVIFISPTATITSGVVNYKVKVEIEPFEDFQLREGLSVTVSLIVAQKSNVLLVPNAAITSEGGKAYVQVVLLEGATEQREIQTGISNWQYTEVTDGLSAGEKIVVPEGIAATTPTSSQQEGPPGGMMIPGMGGPPQ